MASARVNPFAYDRFKQERVQTNPDHQKPLFLHPPFEHVIEYERSKTRSETRLEINVFS